MSLIRFRNIFKRGLPIKLGRWKTNESDEVIYRKAELATDDHCGGDLCQKKIEIKNKEKEITKIMYEMDPLLPYII